MAALPPIPPMPLWLAPLQLVALFSASALTCRGSTRRRWGAFAMSLPALAVPVFLPPSPFWRALFSLMAVAGVMRMADLAREPRQTSGAWRVAFLFAFFDLRAATRRRPAGSGRLLVTGLASSALVGACAVALASLSGAGPGPGSVGGMGALRTVIGAVYFYSALDAMDRLFRFGLGRLLLDLPPMQRAPIRSTSLTELWGDRWNRVVNRWVRHHVFWPVGRRLGPLAGMAASFAYTALLHAWPTWVSLDLRLAGSMGAFFLVQGALVILERPLGVAGWGPLKRRAWTWGWMIVTLPLFMEPALRIFGW